jgi:hypothetical protein
MRHVIVVATIGLLVACTETGTGAPPTSGASTRPVGSITPGPTASFSPSLEPVAIPPGTPASFEEDLEAGDVPPHALVPVGSSAAGIWYADTAAGETVLVAYAIPGTDPFRKERGLVVWRRFAEDPPWRPVYGIRDPPARGVLQVGALVGDATGDGSDDALTFEGIGGSGACGTWRVLDLAANLEVFKEKTCDASIDLSPDPIGLVVREAVYEEGDAHCCPSAFRTTVLVYEDTADQWSIDSDTVRPT